MVKSGCKDKPIQLKHQTICHFFYLLATKTREIFSDIVPRLKRVSAYLDDCRHRVRLLSVYQIVTIEQTFLIGEDCMPVGWYINVFIQPVVHI